eukprot:g1472.t1
MRSNVESEVDKGGGEDSDESSHGSFVKVELFRNGQWVDDNDDDENDAAGNSAADIDLGCKIFLSREWQERFKKTALRRAERANAASRSVDSTKAPAWRNRSRMAKAGAHIRKKYVKNQQHEHAQIRREKYPLSALEKICDLETFLNSRFDRHVDTFSPSFWPAIPM